MGERQKAGIARMLCTVSIIRSFMQSFSYDRVTSLWCTVDFNSYVWYFWGMLQVGETISAVGWLGEATGWMVSMHMPHGRMIGVRASVGWGACMSDPEDLNFCAYVTVP